MNTEKGHSEHSSVTTPPAQSTMLPWLRLYGYDSCCTEHYDTMA